MLNFSAAALGAIGAFVCYTLRDDHGWPAGLALAAGTRRRRRARHVHLRRHGLAAQHVAAQQVDRDTRARSLRRRASCSSSGPISSTAPTSLLPDRSIVLTGDLRINQDRLILIGLALVLAVVLRGIYSGTLFGLATSAVSENRRVAAIARWAPGRIEFVNYVIAGFLSALAAILLAPIIGLNATVLSIAVLPALAAALVGRFSSFALTVVAALAIGVIQSEISLFQPDLAHAFGVSVPSLTGLTRSRAAHHHPGGHGVLRTDAAGPGRDRGPPSPARQRAAVATAVRDRAHRRRRSHRRRARATPTRSIVTFGIGIIIASVVVVSGYAGQLSLCQYALAGFGAWAAARSANSWDVPLPRRLVIGVIVAVVVGVLVALPAIRTRGVTLAIVTLALSLVFSALIFQNASLTGGFEGIRRQEPRDLRLPTRPVRASTAVRRARC